tara:strand:- start:38561 stop:39730 length:1170 start_codon:yes stop_codon:yes gene_type:complete
MRNISYGKQTISRQDIKAVSKSLLSRFITQGPLVQKFEKKLSNYFGSKYCLALSSGTAALNLALLSLNLKKKDIVITTPITFLASASCIINVGCKILLVDINEKNFTINIDLLEKKLKQLKIKKISPKALIAVDYAGYPCNWKKIKKLSKKYKFVTINDNCHAMGSKYFGSKKYAIKYSDIVTQSFHPVKTITTGEGGALYTNKLDIFKRVKSLRSHCIDRSFTDRYGLWHYKVDNLGFNYRLTDIQSSLGISQLNQIDKFVNKRKKIAKNYDKLIQKYPQFSTIQKSDKEIDNSYHLYPLLFDFKKYNVSKKNFFLYMKKKGITLQVHYIPLQFHNLIKKNTVNIKDKFMISEKFYQRSFSIPIYPDLKYSQQKLILKLITNYLIKNF